MAENMQQVQYNSEEIDLLVVLERAVSFLYRYKKILFIFFLIGGVLGAVVHKFRKKSFESTLILRSQLLNNAEEIAIVGRWNEMLQEEDVSVLKTLMNTDDNLLDQVRALSAAPISNPPGTSGFTIDVSVKNPDILPKLQAALIFGLQNSEYVREKVAIKKAGLTDMIATLTREIAKIDSFDSYSSYRSGLKTGATTVLNLSDTNSRRVMLQQRLNENRDALKFINPILVLQDFPSSEKPRGMRLATMAVLGAGAGLFIGFLLALYFDLKRSISLMRQSRTAPLSQNEPA